ncbi:LacI family DNA-binding transcriptional regulator [Priestia flexa]|uniref:LacI family DNA-binding transcriptional regulator n=1 Tax=Priestia flexa TaxID=86664 RepID=A0A8I1SNK8_9BACI|nr:LacI family DNA-binding transcriptional regulator [Priestia flexa]MBN8252185.1 LacI family DNA-binding transcriptional regulator [Priestia flexa]
MTTLKEVATAAKVSSTTASRVLNNDHTLSVSDETRSRVLKAAKALNYTPVRARKGETGDANLTPRIGIMFAQTVEEELADPFFSSIRHGIENACIERGILTNRMFRLKSMRREEVLHDLDGLIVVGRISAETIQTVSNHLDNIIFVNHLADENTYDSVISDFERATESALEHLIQLGYQRIGYIGGREREHFINGNQVIEDKRQTTFEKILEKKGMFYSSDVHIGEFAMAQGYELMEKAIKQGNLPEAFFIASDSMAIGAMRALQKANRKVPEDVAIVSFNDVDVAEFTSTPLTTVKIYTEQMGQLAVNLLMDRINGRKIPLKVTVPTKLVIRDSCGLTMKRMASGA